MGIYNPRFGTGDKVRERVLNWTNPKKPHFCPDECRFLSPWERFQSAHKMHICRKYKKRVKHGRFHPKLIKLPECNL